MRHFVYPGATSTICGLRVAGVFSTAVSEHDVNCPNCRDALASR